MSVWEQHPVRDFRGTWFVWEQHPVRDLLTRVKIARGARLLQREQPLDLWEQHPVRDL